MALNTCLRVDFTQSVIIYENCSNRADRNAIRTANAFIFVYFHLTDPLYKVAFQIMEETQIVYNEC